MENMKTLVAIDVCDTANSEHKKVFDTIEKDDKIYFLMSKGLVNADMPLFAETLKTFFQNLKKGVEVDFDSFATFKNEHLNGCSIITNLLLAMKFWEKDPYTMKTKDVKVVEHKIKSSETTECVEISKTLADAQFFCRRLQDTPSDIMTPEKFVEEVTELFKPLGSKVKINVLDKKAITDKGMNLILAVNKGSDLEPRLMTVEYKASSKNDLFAYVGKGITYDSGGMSLKPSASMKWMKYDMSGAAIVASTVYALAKNDVKTNVVAVMPLTENMLSPSAVRPDDIVTSYNGITVEIDNTDAEGRLILADALTYAAKDLNASKIFDVATLTGAMIFSLGDTYTGCWATSDTDWDLVKKASQWGGEFIWRLPFHDDFLKPLKSDFADLKNSCNDRRAGSSRAACFLKEFTMSKNYIHFDVAATADKNDRGQGVLIKTLYRLAKESF